MHIQVIVIVGDRSVGEDGDVEWENVYKTQRLFTYTKPLHTMFSARWKLAEADRVAKYVRTAIRKLLLEYTSRFSISSEGG